MQLVISPVPDTATPTLVFGFTSADFSQCVYITVDEDPIAVLKYAEELADGFVKAAGLAVQSARKVREGANKVPASE